MTDQVRYMQLGVRICIYCFNNFNRESSVALDLEDCRALGREVRRCENCGVMAIGEKVPASLQKFFDNTPEDDDMPAQERVVA